jgi:hypothetical protein
MDIFILTGVVLAIFVGVPFLFIQSKTPRLMLMAGGALASLLLPVFYFGNHLLGWDGGFFISYIISLTLLLNVILGLMFVVVFCYGLVAILRHTRFNHNV